MVVNADVVLKDLLARDPSARNEWDRDYKLKNDPRITRIGAFLRKTSLDELPQLFNVLKGDMSLVGPRPVVEDELRRYGEDAGYYLQVRPGITGMWQVSGRNDVDYRTRVEFDAWYVKNWSLWTDVVILLKTARVVMTRIGAY
jgi:undecaprenyl-phosphate galactose phosphotransferase